MTKIRLPDRGTRIRDTSKKPAVVAPEVVATALGASSVSPAIRSELARRLGSTGGRPALANAARRQKIPLAEEDWAALVALAESMSDRSPRPTPGQIASALIRIGLKEPPRQYPIIGNVGASRASDSAVSPAGAPRYASTIALACRGYLDQLEDLAAGAPVRVATVALALRDLIEAAQARPDRVPAAAVGDVIALVEALPLDDRARLVNQFALGLGRDDAEVIAVGTEQAFELTDARSLVMASCADQVSWLTAGRTDPTSMADGAARRPFCTYPTDWHDVSAAHTWARLSAVLGSGAEHRRGASPALGDLAYQIELSAFPSKRNRAGLVPTPERLRFLEAVIRTQASTARVLLFHGRAGAAALEGARRTLAYAFTGVEQLDWIDVGEPYRPLRYADAAGRRVIVTRALANAGATWDFLRRLAEVVHGHAVARIPPRRPPPSTVSRRLLDDAAAVVRDTLGIELRPNGSDHADKNREGVFARDVQIGMTTTNGTFRVFLRSRAPDRHQLFDELVAALDAQTLPQPVPDAAIAIEVGSQARDLRYLGIEVSAAETDDLVEITAQFAAWLLRVRDRF